MPKSTSRFYFPVSVFACTKKLRHLKKEKQNRKMIKNEKKKEKRKEKGEKEINE